MRRKYSGGHHLSEGSWARTVHYEVVLDPDETVVRVPSIDLQAQHASGHVVIDDRLVTLTNVAGQTADGQIQTTRDAQLSPARL